MAPPAVADDTDADAPPPQLPALLRPRSDAELSALRQEALAYAAANGLLMAVPPAQQPAPEQTLYGHAPFALLPDRFPAREYVRARDLAPLFNTLVRACMGASVFGFDRSWGRPPPPSRSIEPRPAEPPILPFTHK